MSGALVGFRVDGVNKLMRLHGERSCEQVLGQMLVYLRLHSDEELRAYARRVQAVSPEDGPRPDADAQAWLEAFFAGQGSECASHAWADIFAALPDMSSWHAGLPFMPGATLDNCGDVSWGFLFNLDACQLQIFYNRHNHFRWRELAAQLPFCSLQLAHARQLRPGDAAALHAVLNAHTFSDGIDPILPARDGLSPRFPAPGGWDAWVQLRQGRVQLLLRRDTLQVEVRQVGELRLDHPVYGDFLGHAVDATVLHLARAIYGAQMSLTQLGRVAAHMAQLPFTPEDSGLPLLDLGLRPSSGLALSLGDAYFDGLKARLLEAGMSNQGWKFLVKQSGPVLRALLDFFPPSARNLAGFSHFVNLLATALQAQPLLPERCQPALRGVERILERGRGKIDPMREENARIFIRAIMRAELSPEDAGNLPHEAQDVSDFIYAQPGVLPGARITWNSLCRRSMQWHRALLADISPERDVHWQALLPTHAAGDLLAIELSTGAALAEEGLEQKHCVGTYANACASGSCRVFSLRRQGKRTATIELRREADGSWGLAQVRGKCNSIVRDAEVLAIAGQVASAYSRMAAHAATGGEKLTC